MTFDSQPVPGLTLTLDTASFQTPSSVTGVVNATRTIGARDLQQAPDGKWYRFVEWSDGGDLSHDISTPAPDTTFTAQFICVAPEVQNLMLNPGAGGTLTMSWDPPDRACLQNGPGRYRVYSTAIVEPSIGDGEFPSDPAYALVGASKNEQMNFEPGPNAKFFLVVATDPDDELGVSGHYGS